MFSCQRRFVKLFTQVWPTETSQRRRNKNSATDSRHPLRLLQSLVLPLFFRSRLSSPPLFFTFLCRSDLGSQPFFDVLSHFCSLSPSLGCSCHDYFSAIQLNAHVVFACTLHTHTHLQCVFAPCVLILGHDILQGQLQCCLMKRESCCCCCFFVFFSMYVEL